MDEPSVPKKLKERPDWSQQEDFPSASDSREENSSDDSESAMSSSDSENESESTLENSETDESQFVDESTGVEGERVSSPLTEQHSLIFTVSSISNKSLPLVNTTENDDARKLFEGSEVSVKDVTTLIDLFCSRFALSDEGSSTLHSIIRGILPADNCFPTGFLHLQNEKRNFSDQVHFMRKTSSETLCVLTF